MCRDIKANWPGTIEGVINQNQPSASGERFPSPGQYKGYAGTVCLLSSITDLDRGNQVQIRPWGVSVYLDGSSTELSVNCQQHRHTYTRTHTDHMVGAKLCQSTQQSIKCTMMTSYSFLSISNSVKNADCCCISDLSTSSCTRLEITMLNPVCVYMGHLHPVIRYNAHLLLRNLVLACFTKK